MKMYIFKFMAIALLTFAVVSCNNNANEPKADVERVNTASISSVKQIIAENPTVFENVLVFNDFEEVEKLSKIIENIPDAELGNYFQKLNFSNTAIRSIVVYDSIVTAYVEKYQLQDEDLDNISNEVSERLYDDIINDLVSNHRDLIYFGPVSEKEPNDIVITPIGEKDENLLFNDKGLLVIGEGVIRHYSDGYACFPVSEYVDKYQRYNSASELSSVYEDVILFTDSERKTNGQQRAMMSGGLTATYDFIGNAYSSNTESWYKTTVVISTEPKYSAFYQRQDIKAKTVIKNYKKSNNVYLLTNFPTTVNISFVCTYYFPSGSVANLTTYPSFPSSFSQKTVESTIASYPYTSEISFTAHGISSYNVYVNNDRVVINENM